MNKANCYNISVIESYRAQIKAIAPYLKYTMVAKRVGVHPTTLWRFFQDAKTKQSLDIKVIQKLEEIGILRAPLIVEIKKY